jgi:hypothetical protein
MPHDHPTAWSNAGQLVLVTTATDATTGNPLLERDGSGWREVGEAAQISGRTGTAWGIGLNEARSDARSNAKVMASTAGFRDRHRVRLRRRGAHRPDHKGMGFNGASMSLSRRCTTRSSIALAWRRPGQMSEPMRLDLHANGDQRYRQGRDRTQRRWHHQRGGLHLRPPRFAGPGHRRLHRDGTGDDATAAGLATAVASRCQLRRRRSTWR